MRRGVYPGTFDPPTVAHVAIAEAARRQCGLDVLDLVVNDRPLGKGSVRPLVERVAMLEAVAAPRPWLQVRVTEQLLVADVAEGYDVLVLGADKWAQVLDVSFYDSPAARDAALARLPALAVAPRGDHPLPDGGVVLDVDLAGVSSSLAREGRLDLVAPEVRARTSGRGPGGAAREGGGAR